MEFLGLLHKFILIGHMRLPAPSSLLPVLIRIQCFENASQGGLSIRKLRRIFSQSLRNNSS